MVSKCIDARYFETYFVLKYCMISQICSKSYVSFDFRNSTVHVDVFLSYWRDVVLILSNAHNPLFDILH